MPGDERQPQEDATYRPAARVLLVDEEDRVLLFCYPAGGVGACYWVPPGGGLLPGEDHEAAARRELAEETGLTGLELRPLGWRRRLTIAWAGSLWDQEERWFHARCRAADVDPAALARLRTEGVTDVRWWSPEEIAGSDARFVPARLGELLPAVLSGEAAAGLRDVGG